MGKLTVRTIESARPKEKAYKLMDGDGLQLRVATDGVKTWLVRYMVDGTERQYRLPRQYRDTGGEGFYSLQDAREQAAMIRALARQGIDYQCRLEKAQQAEAEQRQAQAKQLVQQAEAARIENLTVQDLFDVWLQDGVRRKDGNAELRRSFNADVLPRVGSKPVREVSEHDFRAVLRVMVSRGVNRAAVVMRNNLTQMFAWAEKRQPWRRLLADGNPMDLIEIEKIVSQDYDLNNQRDRILSGEEIRELSDMLKRMKAQYDSATDKRTAAQPLEQSVQCAIWIMLSTLCRVGELSMARWEHIGLDAGEWFIPRENVKGNLADLTVYLSSFALSQFRLLHSLTGHSEWCFPARNKEGHVCVKSMSKQIGDRQAMFKKGRDGKAREPMKNRRHDNTLVLSDGRNGAWTPHDLRRTGATLMQGSGVSLEIIDRCQNHVLPGSKVRRHYLHHDYMREKKEAWQILGDRLSLIIHPVNNVVVLRKS
ncbi:tyrosine-type recombinase/integrase [Noviherbaspirillum galbum]|uniref:Tyrosine-type recombinase/integrase n=1 Tax=Noviherbaspirillum galbum TaxID=2709383 RepID=A0A6B3SXG9_9BURK|nr:site-specific integrase [Noviherbaspirillum galbum]NEX62459.1 tyrosine-type recombinase/integrase [Noviherbaspirillum galbum]